MSTEKAFFPLGSAVRRARLGFGRSAPEFESALMRLSGAIDARYIEASRPVLGPSYELARLAGPHAVEILFLSAALFCAEGSGSTRIELNPRVLEGQLKVLGAVSHEIEAIHALVQREDQPCALIGPLGVRRPLILDDGYLYFERNLCLEIKLASRLKERLSTPLELVHDTEDLCAVVHELPGVALNAGQCEAVQRVLHTVASGQGGLIVITGGPGTGKTYVIASLLRALARLALPNLPHTPAELFTRIAFAAPTGRAAHRMGESLRRAIESGMRALPDEQDHGKHTTDQALLAAIETECGRPQTLHRLLGYRPATGKFRHHAKNPIDANVVLVDEASMIDLAMMRQLLEALDGRALLILLGDADQLPSVEAGAVLRELVEARDMRLRSRLVTLVESHRQRAGDPEGRSILETAHAINQGTLPSPDVLIERRRVDELAFRGVEHIDEALVALQARWFEDFFVFPAFAKRIRHEYRITAREAAVVRFTQEDETHLSELFAEVQRRKILGVTRGQIDTLNEWFHTCHAQDDRLFTQSVTGYERRFLPGEPVMMCRNDDSRAIFNGDQGIVLRVSERVGTQSFQVVFMNAQGFNAFPLHELRDDLEHAFAMTVHKSQGSEFDRILFVLPDRPTPLLTREIIYTALTRAKRSVVIHGQKEMLAEGARRRAERSSGLVERLLQNA